jgi:hypothetical protein
MTTIKIETGFDRNLSYEDIKEKLLSDLRKKYDKVENLDTNDNSFKSKERIFVNQLTYLILAILQLKNGSRSIESVWAFNNFIKKRNFNETILVKIAKSECVKYDNKTKKQYKTKIRYRKMVFPISWINIDKETYDLIEKYSSEISDDRLKKRTLDYLLKYHNCNTHSLRYCFINYMINEKKVPLNDVAKTVGHVNLDQLCRYTQAKNIDKVLGMDE